MLQGLEATPVENENGGIEYQVNQLDLALHLTLWPYLGVIDLTLIERSSQAILLDITVAVRGRIRYISDMRRQYLLFPECVLVGRSLSSRQNEAAFSGTMVGQPMRVALRPRLSVLFN